MTIGLARVEELEASGRAASIALQERRVGEWLLRASNQIAGRLYRSPGFVDA